MARAFAELSNASFSSDGTIYMDYNVTYVDPIQVVLVTEVVQVVVLSTDSAIGMQIKLSAAIKEHGASIGLVVTNNEITQPAYQKGITVYQPVRAATTTNINIASPGDTFDGVTFVSSDTNLRLLVRAQSNGAQNGIYTWTDSTTPLERASDANDDSEVVNGAGVVVLQGTTLAVSQWLISSLSPAPWVDDTSATIWSRFVFPVLS